MAQNAIVDVSNLRTTFHVKRGGRKFALKAVNDVSFKLNEGEILGFVGETGCGKTTGGRSMLGLAPTEGGTVEFDGQNVLKLSGKAMRAARLSMRMVFQDPYASLNPRRSVGDSIAEAGDFYRLFASKEERVQKIAEALTNVGLNPSFATRFPHELSGGQRQRVGIARAILPTPKIIIADEPVSALDVSVQAQVLNLLVDLKKRLNLTILFISHDLSVVGQICDRIAVMYLGRIVELADAETLYSNPIHPYTKALIDAVPRPDPRRRITENAPVGEPPSRFDLPSGCEYANRCPLVSDKCHSAAPTLDDHSDGRKVACHNVEAAAAG